MARNISTLFCRGTVVRSSYSHCNCVVASFPSYRYSSSDVGSRKNKLADKFETIKTNNRIVHDLFKNDKNVRKILLGLTRFDLAKIYRPEKPIKCQYVEVKFVTNEDLQQLREKAQEHFENSVEFGPVPLWHEDLDCNDQFLDEDPRLAFIDQCPVGFVDISRDSFSEPGVALKEHTRDAWERKPSGQLWRSGKGCGNMRDRMVKSVYKKVYREPSGLVPIFEDEQLFHSLLAAGKFSHVINVAFQNFLLDDLKLKSILDTVFDFICKHSRFEDLKSTKHYPILLLHILSDVQRSLSYLHFHVEKGNPQDICLFFKLMETLSHEIGVTIENGTAKIAEAEVADQNLTSEKSVSKEEALRLVELFLSEIDRSFPDVSLDRFRKSVEAWKKEDEYVDSVKMNAV